MIKAPRSQQNQSGLWTYLRLYSIVGVLVLVLLSACSAEQQTSTSSAPEGPQLSHKIIHTSKDYSGVVKFRGWLVLSSEEQYREQLGLYPELPMDIDFNSYKVLYYNMGRNRSVTDSINISGLEEYSDRIVANIELSLAGNSCVIPGVETSSYMFALISTTKEIEVKEAEHIRECG